MKRTSLRILPLLVAALVQPFPAAAREAAPDELRTLLMGPSSALHAALPPEGDDHVERSITRDLRLHAQLAQLAATDPELSRAMRERLSPDLNFAVAVILLEGHAAAGRMPVVAMEHMAAAAEGGHARAAFRLALAHEHGFQVARDVIRADALYRSAFEGGDVRAAFALGRLHEEGALPGGVERSLEWYARGAGGTEDRMEEWPYEIASAMPSPGELVAERIVAGSRVLTSEAGWEMLRGTLDPDDAVQLADAYACFECGGTIDLAPAARWYRVAASAGSAKGRHRLRRILAVRPELALDPEEDTRLGAAILGSITVNASNAGVQGLPDIDADELDMDEAADACADPFSLADVERAFLFFEGLCEPWYDDAGHVLHAVAVGRHNPAAAAGAIERLRERADRAAADDDPWTELTERIRLADALAFYGDFEGALVERERIDAPAVRRPDIAAAWRRYDARNDTMRRVANAKPRDVWDGIGLTAMLRRLARDGDTTAGALLAASPEAASTASAVETVSVSEALAAVERVSVLGAAPAHAEALRLLATSRFRDGDLRGSLRDELAALNLDLDLSESEAAIAGRIPARLRVSCALTRVSRTVRERTRDADATIERAGRDLSLVLAKRAVNTVQGVRKALGTLPAELQGCFADAVSDHYRWLADLMVELGRPEEAVAVLDMLKDFETFRFFGRDGTVTLDAFDALELSDAEAAILDTLGRLKPLAGARVARQRALQVARARGALTADEGRELAELEEAADRNEARLNALLDAVLEERGGGTGEAARASASLQGDLQYGWGGDTAALHIVVLPDRAISILTTPDAGAIPHVVERLGAEPFTEASLDRLIEDFRAELMNPRSDPRRRARVLYDAFLAPLDADLRASGATRLMVSADRRLRYVPFAALHDGDGWLVERFAISHPIDRLPREPGRPSRGGPVAALGVTKALSGFQALPGVSVELDALVRERRDDPLGILDGRALLDEDFTETAFRDAPVLGMRGTVHLATHFKFGTDHASSGLLLGDGTLLTVERMMAMNLRMEDVDLLTLSACETAVGAMGSDGSEIESFARGMLARSRGTVLATLWPVNDAATPLVVERFYQGVERDGLARSEALARAMRALIAGSITEEGASMVEALRGAFKIDIASEEDTRWKRHSHPFYWAPFVLMGGS